MNERQKTGLLRIAREAVIEQGESLIDKLPSRVYALPVVGSWLIDRSARRGESRAKRLLDEMTRIRERSS